MKFTDPMNEAESLRDKSAFNFYVAVGSEKPSRDPKKRCSDRPSARREYTDDVEREREEKAADDWEDPGGTEEAPGLAPAMSPDARAARTNEQLKKRAAPPPQKSFLALCQQDYQAPTFTRTHVFLELPFRVCKHVLEEWPLITRRGRTAGSPRFHLAVLSFLAGRAKEQRQYGESTIEYVNEAGEAEVDGQWEAVSSMRTIARTIRERFFFKVTHDPEELPFSTFERKIRRVVGDLDGMKGPEGRVLLKRLGPARDTGDKKSDCFGQRFTIAGSAIDDQLVDLDFSPAPPMVSAGSPGIATLAKSEALRLLRLFASPPPPARSTGDASPPTQTCSPPSQPADPLIDLCELKRHCGPARMDDLKVDVAGLYDRLLTQENLWAEFREQIIHSLGKRCRDQYTKDGFKWQRRQAQPSTAKAAKKSKHVSVGAFRRGDAPRSDRRRRPCTVPYVVFDIDAERDGSSGDTWRYAKRLVRRLRKLGADDLVATYSGNTSFHVRLPAGNLGLPIFRSSSEAGRILRHFMRRVCEGLSEGLRSKLDTSLASPLHLIRAVGSRHEEQPTKHCVAFTSEQLDSLGFMAFDAHSQMYKNPPPLPRPEQALPAPALIERLLEGVDRKASDQEYAGNRGIIERIKEGVRKADEFANGHTGRNRAALLYADHLLGSGMTRREARHELEEWNEKCIPPLGEAPDDEKGELKYVLKRAANHVNSPID